MAHYSLGINRVIALLNSKPRHLKSTESCQNYRNIRKSESISTISGISGNIQLKMLLESCNINLSLPWIRVSVYLFSYLDIRIYVASATAKCCHKTYYVSRMIYDDFSGIPETLIELRF